MRNTKQKMYLNGERKKENKKFKLFNKEDATTREQELKKVQHKQAFRNSEIFLFL